jgi:hypothetical protein
VAAHGRAVAQRARVTLAKRDQDVAEVDEHERDDRDGDERQHLVVEALARRLRAGAAGREMRVQHRGDQHHADDRHHQPDDGDPRQVSEPPHRIAPIRRR